MAQSTMANSIKKSPTGSELQLVKYQRQLTNRNFPILFIVVCFLVIANTSCDKVGSANVSTSLPYEATEISSNSSSTSSKSKHDPLRMFREIYLDENIKIEMFHPQSSGGDTVQKFHPNGRYGRRSVDNMVEPAFAHSELGRLKDDNGPLKSFLQHLSQLKENIGNPNESGKSMDSNLANNDHMINEPNNQMLSAEVNGVANFQQELNKLLRCNYTGVSNLYWCYSGN